MSCGAAGIANAVMTELLLNEPLEMPVIDLDDPAFKPPTMENNPLYLPIAKVGIDALTTRVVNGDGVFDGIMQALNAHLKEEYAKGRITGAEYSKTYIALTDSAMNQGVALLLGQEQSYWAAVNAQMQAITARVQLDISRAMLGVQLTELQNKRAEFALTKLRLANEDQQYCISKYTLENMLPLQKAGQEYQNQVAQWNLENMLPEQKKLVTEQMEAARAQTSDARTDGLPVAGSIGKQKSLYDQQITSYKRSAELGAARVWADAWLAHKAIDEGIDTPAAFNATTVSAVMDTLKLNNQL